MNGSATGNLYGTVTDNQGQSLGGVTVTLTGNSAPQVELTNVEGQFRYVEVATGTYTVKAELEFFSTAEYPNILIEAGRNTDIEMMLTPVLEA